jgi:transcriptional regulator with XRE-family HTH domain
MTMRTMMAKALGFFAARLRELRSAAALSQTVLAERAGLSVSTVRQFEYGLREPTYGTLVKLADGLDVSLEAFRPPAKPRRKRKKE